VDDALRNAERKADWRQRATALRRAGREDEARRCLEAAVEAGRPLARGLLDAWFPPDDVEALLAKPSPWVPAPLLGDPDPRLIPPLEAWAAQHGEPWVLELLQLPLIDRLVAASQRCGGAALERTRLTPDEALSLFDAFDATGWAVGDRLWPRDQSREFLRMNVAWLLSRYGDERAETRRASLAQVGAPGWLPPDSPAVTRDPLTLCIRRELALRALEQGKAGPWVVLLDLDRFKGCNDRFGCQIGDAVLHRAARALRGAFGDRVARHGGDEFLVLSDEAAVEATRKALEAVAAVRVPVEDGDAEAHVTVSAGISTVAPGRGWEVALRRADEAVAEAKAAGGDAYRLSP
jgi:diguanylate cyclase (GGDEF)-like protein